MPEDKIDDFYKYVPIEISSDGIIGFALRSEYDSFRFYRAAHKVVENTEAKELLGQLAKAERSHFDALKRAFKEKFPEDFKEAEQRIKDGTIGYLSVEKELVKLAEMGVVEIISIALWEERKALELYETALEETDEKNVEKLLMSLITTGKKHIEILSEYREKYISEGPKTD